MVLSGKSLKALKILRWVAAFNGKKEEGEKLSLEVGAEENCSLGQDTGLCACLCFPCSQAHLPSDAPSKLLSRPQACTVPLLPPACRLLANGTPPSFCPKELKLNLQKEISLAKAKYSIADLFRTPTLRRVTFCLSLAW